MTLVQMVSVFENNSQELTATKKQKYFEAFDIFT